MKHQPEILATYILAKARLFHIQQVNLQFSNSTKTRFKRMCSSPQDAVRRDLPELRAQQELTETRAITAPYMTHDLLAD